VRETEISLSAAHSIVLLLAEEISYRTRMGQRKIFLILLALVLLDCLPTARGLWTALLQTGSRGPKCQVADNGEQDEL